MTVVIVYGIAGEKGLGQARGCSKCLNRKERTEGKGLARARCSTDRRIKISMISPHDNIHPRPRRSSSWESPSAEPQPGGVGAGGEVPLAIRFWRVAPGPGARRSQHRDSWQRSRHERPASPAARPSLPRQSRRATRRLVNAFVMHSKYLLLQCILVFFMSWIFIIKIWFNFSKINIFWVVQ